MKQTAVEWLFDQIPLEWTIKRSGYEALQIALQMEKEQIIKTAIECHFEGVRQSAKTSEDYIAYGEQYYNEIYGK
jgi:hypothetical protein